MTSQEAIANVETKDEGGLSQEDSNKGIKNGQILTSYKYVIFHRTIDFKIDTLLFYMPLRQKTMLPIKQ